MARDCRAVAVGASRPTGTVGRALVGVLLSTVAWRWAARAQQPDPTLNIQFHGFTDSRSVTVLSPTVDLDKDFTDRTGLRVRFGVDAITAASDSCIRCHPNGAHNQRSFVNGSLIRRVGNTSVSAGAEFSKENFYTATTAMTSISRTFNNANTTVAGGYSFSWNGPMLHPSEFVESQHAQSAFGALTQTLTKTTIAQFGVEVSRIDGYQSNPYLRAIVDGVRLVGVAPDRRQRASVSLRLRQALPRATYLEADVRRYEDDWRLRATTYSLGFTHDLSPRWTMAASYRHHDQTGTSFYAPSYSGNPQYFTADFRLFPFRSRLYTGRLVFTPAGRLFGSLPQGSKLLLQYEFYDATTGFQAATVTTGVRVPLARP